MKIVGSILKMAVVAVAAFLVSLLATHVVLSIAELYSLAFITAFSFAQIFGLYCVVSLVSYTNKNLTKKQKEQPTTEAFKSLGFKALFYLIVWGTASVGYLILS